MWDHARAARRAHRPSWRRCRGRRPDSDGPARRTALKLSWRGLPEPRQAVARDLRRRANRPSARLGGRLWAQDRTRARLRSCGIDGDGQQWLDRREEAPACKLPNPSSGRISLSVPTARHEGAYRRARPERMVRYLRPGEGRACNLKTAKHQTRRLLSIRGRARPRQRAAAQGGAPRLSQTRQADRLRRC